MNRFWMMGVAAVVVSVGVVALQVRPIRSSDNLLGTAQAQFAVKARDALIQRRMTLAQPIAPAARDAVPAISEIPNLVASREPVAMPTVAGYETPAAALAAEAPSLTRSTRAVAVMEQKLSAAPTIENIRAVEPPASENVVEPKVSPSTASVAAPAPELGFTEDTLSNGLLILRFGPSGEIVSCLDASGAEHSAGGLNRLVLHRDRYQWPWDAWDIDPTVATRAPRTLRPVEVETTIDGPTVVRRQRYRERRFTIDQRVILEAGSDTVRFDTTVDWHEKHRMLRAEFRPAHFGDTADSEIQFGHISRPTTENGPVEKAQFEICAHKWIATRDASGGFALLNDAKFGHRAKNGLLSLSILRAPTFPDKTADRGVHHFSYAFCPFDVSEGGGQDTAGLTKVIREGYRLNNPLIPAEGAALEPAVTVDHPAIIVETIKSAESGAGVVLRLYESLGKPAEAALRTTVTHVAAIETDLMENPLGTIDLGRLAFGPFEIKTILLEARR